jgi:hypothetical protein
MQPIRVTALLSFRNFERGVIRLLLSLALVPTLDRGGRRNTGACYQGHNTVRSNFGDSYSSVSTAPALECDLVHHVPVCALEISFVQLMISNDNDKISDNKHCLNRVAASVLKVKSVCSECLVKTNVYSF